MTQVLITEKANEDIADCQQFLYHATGDRQLILKVLNTLHDGFSQLEIFPQSGRLYADNHGFRELVIPFGKRAYIALYQYDVASDTVFIMRLRHGLTTDYH